MKIKTCELKGAALDWAVAKCEGFPNGREYQELVYGPDESFEVVPCYSYSHNWFQGGPIIEREGIAVFLGGYDKKPWTAASCDTPEWDRNPDAYGETPLIAAMRCYVTSKLGDEVEVPEELL